MNQSNYIFALLFIAYVIYITMRGELSTYMGFFIPVSKTVPTDPLTGTQLTFANRGSLSPNYASVGAASQMFGSTYVPGLGWLGVKQATIVPKGTPPI